MTPPPPISPLFPNPPLSHSLQKTPPTPPRHNREVNLLEDRICALCRRVAAFSGGMCAHRREQQNQDRARNDFPYAAALHRASLEGAPGRGATCSTRRAIFAANCPTEDLT